jgi:hypothetical protein
MRCIEEVPRFKGSRLRVEEMGLQVLGPASKTLEPGTGNRSSRNLERRVEGSRDSGIERFWDSGVLNSLCAMRYALRIADDRP